MQRTARRPPSDAAVSRRDEHAGLCLRGDGFPRGIPGIRAEVLRPPFASCTTRRLGAEPLGALRRVSGLGGLAAADVFHVVDHGNAQLLWRLPPATHRGHVPRSLPPSVVAGRLRFAGSPSGPACCRPRCDCSLSAERAHPHRLAPHRGGVPELPRHPGRPAAGAPRKHVRGVLGSTRIPTLGQPGPVGVSSGATWWCCTWGAMTPEESRSGMLDAVARLRSAALAPAREARQGGPAVRPAKLRFWRARVSTRASCGRSEGVATTS